MSSNYFVSIHGRGASYAFLIQNAETQDLANKCQPAVNSGFEVYIYELSASPLGQPSFTPTGALCLKRVYHLYDAHAEFEDEANSIVSRLTAHSEAASIEYLETMLKVLSSEHANLKCKGDVYAERRKEVDTRSEGEVRNDDSQTKEERPPQADPTSND